MKRSCVHFVTPEGKIIPFDTYNLLYRDGRIDSVRARARARIEAGVPIGRCLGLGAAFLVGALLLLPGACFGMLGDTSTASYFYMAGGALIALAIAAGLFGSGGSSSGSAGAGRRHVASADDLLRILERDERREPRNRAVP